MGSRDLHQGEEAKLEEILGSKRGAVNALSIINDTDNQIDILLDSELQKHQKLTFHPMTNEALTEISYQDFINFLKHSGKYQNAKTIDFNSLKKGNL